MTTITCPFCGQNFPNPSLHLSLNAWVTLEIWVMELLKGGVAPLELDSRDRADLERALQELRQGQEEQAQP